ncbi:protein pxr1-like [Nicotiana sylvestris]|uniref:protein pxr1-like n=1 Tax=Nicotiana sylvestris TaxID=4096 RepID=UPI00388CA4BA
MRKGVAESSPIPIGLTKESRAMVVWNEESTGEEESVREIEESGSGEVVEGLVRLGKNVQEPIPANKKRKGTLSIPVETPPTRGGAIRSQKKQSDAELEKTLEESKKKDVAKVKKKAVEPVEVVEIDEMDLVFRNEEDTEEMEVVTPKAKKAKTSTKKSVSKTKSAEPSTLAKRARSALKSRKVKRMNEEEWWGRRKGI